MLFFFCFGLEDCIKIDFNNKKYNFYKFFLIFLIFNYLRNIKI